MNNKTKISKTFIGFLVASCLIWLLITLSKEYKVIIELPIKYYKLPQDKLLQEKPIETISLLVKGSGFNIVSSKFKKNSILINSKNLLKTNRGYVVLINKQKVAIQKQLQSGLLLEQVLLDSIYLDLGVLKSKKVKITHQLEVNYHIGYEALEAIKITPDSVLISGPEKQLETIKEVFLEKLTLDDVKSDFSKKINIIKPKKTNNLKFGLKNVVVNGVVDKFTEGSVEVPFQIKNKPSNIDLTTFPKKVKITFKVALSNFGKVDANFFDVYCDYKTSKENNYPYLIPIVNSPLKLVKSFKVTPNKIDFLIQK